MKSLHNIPRALMAIALMCVFSLSANAQLNGVLNKAKKAAKSAVEKTVSDSKSTAGASTTQSQAGTQSQTAAQTQEAAAPEAAASNDDKDLPFYEIKYTPSAEAVAADPKVSDQTIASGFTRPVGDIHALYEHIDLDNFPYNPYYKHTDFFCMDVDDKFLYNIFITKVSNILLVDSGGSHLMDNKFTYVDEGNKNLVVPVDETFRNAWEWQFIADPRSVKAFAYYANSLTMQDPRGFKAYYKYDIENEAEGIVNSKQGWMLPSKFFNVRRQREDLAYSLALTVFPFQDLLDFTKTVVDRIDNSNGPMKILAYVEGNVLLYSMIPNHDDYADNKDSDTERMLKMKLNTYNYSEMLQAYGAENAAPVDEPKGVAVAADIKAKGTQAAKEYAGDKFVKIIFLRATWETFKEFDYPYRVMSYGMPVAIVTNENGKNLIQNCDLQKSPDGSRWYVSAGKNPAKQPLK